MNQIWIWNWIEINAKIQRALKQAPEMTLTKCHGGARWLKS